MMETILSEDTYVPGDRICQATHAKSGSGTYVRDGYVCASLVGNAKLEREKLMNGNATTGDNNNHQESDNNNTTNNNNSNQTSPESHSSSGVSGGSVSLPVVSIKSLKENTVVIPHIGSLVIAKITSVNPRYAKCSILSVNNIVAKENFPGQINRKDVRATEKDKIEINKSFRRADVIIARVISLGDTNSYFLSVAENELGVVIAYSEDGHRMIPISWNEMQCPLTMLKEHRKVAKIQPEFIDYVDPPTPAATKLVKQEEQQQQAIAID